ncbi:MAG TPA: CHAT domain-containing protein [Thermoanaerobaculia bacterium]|nr:CHAT domain-containing protein [Thermoanaerobaculia bacterium]
MRLLETAVERALPAERAVVLSDLAAALLTRARQPSGSPLDLFRALDVSEKALEYAPGLSEALFNRALALERLTLVGQADVAWRQYLERDAASSWRQEAQEHLSSLARELAVPAPSAMLSAMRAAALAGRQERVQALVEHAHQQVRELVEEELFAGWAEALASGKSERAAEELIVLRVVSRALAASGGDPLDADAVAAIDRATSRGRGALGRLAAAHRKYARALDLAKGAAFIQAKPEFESARRLLRSAGSPLAGWASYQLALCAYESARYARVRALLSSLLDTAENHRYRALLGRSRHLLALVATISGDPILARRWGEEAVDDFGAIGETQSQARTLSLVADADRILGDQLPLWRHLYSSLGAARAAGAAGTGTSRFGPLARAAEAAEQVGLEHAALRVRDESVGDARRRHFAVELCAALKERAGTLGALGHRPLALADLAEATAVASSLLDPEVRRTTEGDILFVRGELETASDPGQALADLDRAVEIAKSTDYRYRLVTLLLNRARAWRTLGRQTDAEDDLWAAVGEAERQREKLPVDDAQSRAALSDRLQEIFHEFVTLALVNGGSELALAYAEWGRAEVLRDWLLGPGVNTRNPAVLLAGLRKTQARLVPGTTAIEFLVMKDRLLVWTLHCDRLNMVSINSGIDHLETLSSQLLAAAKEDKSAEVDIVAAQLYEILIRPIEAQIGPQDRLLLVLDGPLTVVPFSALLDGRTGHYLAADHMIAIAPSLALLHRRSPIPSASGFVKATALAVGDPRFPRALFPDLPALPGARQEAVLVAELFPGSRTLLDGQATRDAFLSQSDGRKIIHFAGHVLVNSQVPLLSRLLLAPGGHDASGVLYARDLVGRRFGNTLLVVLSGCDTGAVALSHSEGVPVLAWPFLAGGVRSVLVSLWSVSDQDTQAFFAEFYRDLQRLGDASRALHEAQVNAAATNRDSEVWRSFELVEVR